MALEEGKAQTKIAEEIGVSSATVSRAMGELQEYELIEEADNGYKNLFPSLATP